jgi:hypothetical protein
MGMTYPDVYIATPKVPQVAMAMKYFVEVSGPQQDHNISLVHGKRV